MWYYNYSNTNYLCHHGVKGMKWGIRKKYEPSDRESGSLEKKKSKHRLKLEEKYRSKGMSQEDAEKAATRKIRAEGIAIATTAVIAAVGVYKLADSGELRRLAEKGKATLHGKKFKYNNREEYSSSDMSAQNIYDQIVAFINPDRHSYGSASIGTNNNCRRCTFAYELSRRGYEVKATKSLRGTGQSSIGLYNAVNDSPIKGGLAGYLKRYFVDLDESVINFNGKIAESGVNGGAFNKIQLGDKNHGESIFSALSNNPSGSRGELNMNFKQRFGGHSMAWEVINGKPVIFDCQTNKMYDTAEKIGMLADRMSNVGFTRLDNVELNNDFLLRWVKNSVKY